MTIYGTNFGWVLKCPGLGEWYFWHCDDAEEYGRTVLGYGWEWKVVPA